MSSKFIVAIDGLHERPEVMDYAVELAKMEDALLVGLFIDDLFAHGYSGWEILGQSGFLLEQEERLERIDAETRDSAVDTFERKCTAAQVRFKVHRDKGVSERELLKECLYADLLLISKYESFSSDEERCPTHLVTRVLDYLPCPTMVLPSVYRPIKCTSLLLDKSHSSIYAIKQFKYVLPQLSKGPIVLLTVDRMSRTTSNADVDLIRELLHESFPDLSVHHERGDARVKIADFLQHGFEDSLVVLGAYDRGLISRRLRKSMADYLMNIADAPLFVAHR